MARIIKKRFAPKPAPVERKPAPEQTWGMGYGGGATQWPGSFSVTTPPVTAPPVSQVAAQRTPWSPPPSDAALDQQYAAYDQQAAGAKTGYLTQSRDILRDYGYQEGGEQFSFGAVDPNNPFSKAALLKQSFEKAQRGNTNSMAARGQLYSGALQRSQDNSLSEYQQGDNALLTALRQNLGQLGQAYAGVDAELAGQKANAYESFINRQIALRPPEPDPTPDPTPPAAATADPATNPWVQRGLKGPRGEQLHVTNKGTFYYRQNANGTKTAIYIKRN
jgi:hypothetical protein